MNPKAQGKRTMSSVSQSRPDHTSDCPAEFWPAWTDNWFWETSPEDKAALEAVETERLTDVWDAQQAGRITALCELADRACENTRRMLDHVPVVNFAPISGGSPDVEPFEPTPEDLDDYRRWSEGLDVKRWLDSNPSFAEWLDANGGPAD
jgi:hypothetical protein